MRGPGSSGESTLVRRFSPAPTLAGVAASSPESARTAAAALGADRAFDSAEELVRDPDVDVVHVCTPNHLHLPLAEAALAAGKHVICEKPLALDVAGAQRLVDAAAESGHHAAVPFVYRYYPTVREARERVASGQTGSVRLLHGTYLQDWLLRPDDSNWRVDEQLGGASRAFADIGSHWCDLAEFVSGHRIARLSARLLTAVPERISEAGRHAFTSGGDGGEARRVTTEDAAVVQFETDGGAVGSVVVSQVSAGRKNRLWIELDGAEEALAFDQEHPEELWQGRREALTILRRDPATLSPAAVSLRLPSRRSPAGVRGLFRCLRGRLLREHRQRLDRGGNAHLLGRAARSADHGRRADVVPRRGLGRRGGSHARLAGGRDMKLGFLTSCMPDRSLEEIAAWAGANGYEALELAAWPHLGDRPFTASHVKADAFDEAEADRVRRALDEHGLVLSALAYYDNNLAPDPAEREGYHAHLRACIDAAAALGGVPVGTFIGRDPGRSVSENLSEAERVFPPLVDYAGERGVRLMIENCVMEGWHPDGYPGNLAYSPELWEWMFALGLHLNFDPSHLLWLGIDPVEALRPYVDHVAHAHAKDAETFPAQRNRYGFFGRTSTREEDPWDMGWWRYRIPGLGDVDFPRYIDTLYEGGFDGVLSVEHEDPVWGGSPELIEAGLRIAHNNLRGLVVQ